MSFDYQKTVNEFNENLNKLVVIKVQILSAKDTLEYSKKFGQSDSDAGSLFILEEKAEVLGNLRDNFDYCLDQLVEIIEAQRHEIKVQDAKIKEMNTRCRTQNLLEKSYDENKQTIKELKQRLGESED